MKRDWRLTKIVKGEERKFENTRNVKEGYENLRDNMKEEK